MPLAAIVVTGVSKVAKHNWCCGHRAYWFRSWVLCIWEACYTVASYFGHYLANNCCFKGNLCVTVKISNWDLLEPPFYLVHSCIWSIINPYFLDYQIVCFRISIICNGLWCLIDSEGLSVLVYTYLHMACQFEYVCTPGCRF